MSLFQTLRQIDIAARAHRATTFIAYVAPGVGGLVGQALADAARRLGRANVVIVLDVSAHVARVGFGEHGVVERLVAEGLTVRTEPHLRLGLLICDSEGWAFALPPNMLESEATGPDSAPNAMVLTPAQVIALRAELPTAESGSSALSVVPAIGERVADPSELKVISEDLKRNPPQPFDLARQVRVFTSAIEFVELSLEGWRIASRTVQMPKDLPILAGNDAELNRRIDATFHLVDRQRGSMLRDLEKQFEELRDAYLRPMGKYLGRVLIRSQRKEFDAKVEQLKDKFEQAKAKLASTLQASLDSTMNELVDRLAKIILSMADPPLKFQARYRGDKAGAERFVRDQLASRIPKARDLVDGMRVHVIVKGVTLEMLRDAEFQRRFFEQVPREELATDLYAEYDAAKARFEDDERRNDPST